MSVPEPTSDAGAESPGAVSSELESSGTFEAAQDVVARLRARLSAVVLGRDNVIELVLTALLADGHVLLEDYPGSGKTTLARALGGAIVVDPGREDADVIAPFRRIQFTPDLLPSDITGTNVFDMERNTFSFRPGPIFAHVVLADEINRTSPKVQSAMLEAMAEKQVTVDNTTHLLDPLFFVIATQNPLDLSGTYPLPAPQLDRFLFKIEMKHISREAELQVLAQYPRPHLSAAQDMPQIGRDELLMVRRVLRKDVHLAPVFKECLVDLARSLRDDRRVIQGASTRALVLMMPALQARAMLQGRDHVSPDDLQALAPHVFRHRLECAAGIDEVDQVIGDALAPQIERLSRELTRG